MESSNDTLSELHLHNKTINGSIFDEEILRANQPWRLELHDHPGFQTFWFENHDNLYWRRFVWEHPLIPYISCILYLATLYALQIWMKDRHPYSLKTPLIIWNWALGAFSAFGFYRISEEVANLFAQENGLHKTICETDGHYHPAAYWGLLFVFSKYIELGDTIFIALKKQRIIALQYYHHCLVTVFAWVLYAWQEPILRWYAMLNFGVHSIMYPYFALRGMNVKVPEIVAMAITSLQVMQMVAGVSLNMYSIYIWGKGETCSRNPHSVAFSLLTYFSLWFMFVQFFRSKYVSKTRRKTKDE